jgi:hypothetical protein
MTEDRKHEEMLHRYVAELVAKQREAVQAHVEAAATVQRLHEIASDQQAALEVHLQRLGGDAAQPSKTLVAALFGASAGEGDGVGPRRVSDVLRDDLGERREDAWP